jgi:GNAT superfamily N-acetyltransferase
MRRILIAAKEELPIIQHIATVAYHHTYVPILGQDQVDFMLNKIYSLKSLSEQLENGHMFIIAREDEMDVGFASYSRKETVLGTYQLQKLYLLPELQGTGLGRFLIGEVISQVKEQGARCLQLNVNRFNKSRGFYEKMGFTIKEKVDIPIGERYYMNDYVMELDIS